MKRIAMAFWLGAVILVADQWAAYFVVSGPTGIHAHTLTISQILASIANSLVYGGGLVGVGFVILLLGQIRDRLPRG